MMVLEKESAERVRPSVATIPTIWGLSPVNLHDRFWAARGIQVVRQGEASALIDDAELYLLTDPRTLAIFNPARVVEHLMWVKPDVVWIRLHEERERGYTERVITSPDGRFQRFERSYGGADTRLARVALTPDRRIAQLWQNARSARAGWKLLREEVPSPSRSVHSVRGIAFDRFVDSELMHFVRELVTRWSAPDATIDRARAGGGSAWVDPESHLPDDVKVIGPVWVGAGRRIHPSTTIVGPAVLWDEPECRPVPQQLKWLEIEPQVDWSRRVAPRPLTPLSAAAKRLFDIVFAACAIVVTLPLYPLIMLAIWLEDGRPFFFTHKRETIGAREFGCVKFRSMRKDADLIKAQLARENQADGPQFFMERDPRITQVGAFLRKSYLDELPQFWNVLLGHMSIVGPRPSPFAENQFCPAWREARLSVRPGVTGLWQIRRTRRKGMDFQEWIKYDIEYVENMSWRMDLKVLWETLRLMIRGVVRS